MSGTWKIVTPDQLTLQERVRRFNLGTPTAMHVCTHELVNDLWQELEMSGQPADANPSRPVRQHSGDRSAMFDYIVNGGDELALTKASLEHALGHLGIEIEEAAKLRAVNADMLAALQLGLHLVQVRWPMTGPESEPEKSTIEFINTAERAIAKATGA